MKKAWENLKAFIAVIMTFALIILLFVPHQINKEILMLFSTSYGAIMTYLFSSNHE